MAVNVDAGTYARYQACSDPELASRLQKFVTIRPVPTPQNFATIQPENSACPFLTEKLCGLQQKLGVEYLSKVCDTYPRLLKMDGLQKERSLDLSCPEAARIVLKETDPIRFELAGGSVGEPRHWRVRQAILSILQNRRYAVSKRLLLVGHVCSKLANVYGAGEIETIPDVLGGFELAIGGGLFNGYLQNCNGKAIPQLAVVLELILGRIQLDYTSPRFLDLYNEFTAGLGLTPDSTLEDLGACYAEGYQRVFAPFMEQHEYILENYLVAYAYKNVFPYGGNSSQTIEAESLDSASQAIQQQYLLMASYFAIVKALMIGIAARQETFALSEAIRVIQVCTKTLEHCTTYPALILETLANKGIQNAAEMAILTQDIVT